MNTSNIDQVMAWLGTWVDGFNFKRPGNDQSLGRDMAVKVVDRISDRSLQDKRGATDSWDGNSTTPSNAYPGGYAEYKEKEYGVADAPNKRTGQMLSRKSLMGRTRIEEKEVTMVYGEGAPPDRCSSGAELKEADKQRTDVEKAYYAHTGQSSKQIKRPFYEVDESDAKAVSDLCQENLNGYIRDTNAARGY